MAKKTITPNPCATGCQHCGLTFTPCSSYADIVDCFSRGARVRHHCQLDMCQNFPSDFVESFMVALQDYATPPCCVPTVQPNEVVRVNSIHWHQWRIKKTILENFTKDVVRFQQNGNLILSNYRDFDEFFDFVASHCSLGYGRCLLTYDFCLRYGYNRGLRPKDYVYLYRGAHEGAEYLFGRKIHTDKLPVTDFYPYLGTSLTSLEIEELLCVCKMHIKYITDHIGNNPVPQNGVSLQTTSKP